MIPTVQLQAVASFAARKAGEFVLANLSRRHDANEVARQDVKHKLDVESQQLVAGIIGSAFPEHDFLGEESADAPMRDERGYRWIVDPIDGTVNFFHGFPWWNCSVAVWKDGRPLAGAVFAPELGQMFEATCDGAAYCNGCELRVSQIRNPELALVATGADKSRPGGYSSRYMNRIGELCQRSRLCGAAALDICQVAAGRSEGFFESGLYLWDYAAAALILERAGGRWEVLKAYNEPKYKAAFLATNGALHEMLKTGLLPLV